MIAQAVSSSNDVDVVWQPIPNSSQEAAINTRAHHTLYYGARGPGKTITQLMRFRRRVGMGYGSYWKGVIFDVEFKHLEDLRTQGNRFFPKFEDGVEWKKSAQDYKWIWPTGEELLLRHVKNSEDYNSFHGHEYAFIGWNELTKWPDLELYDLFMSVNRSSFQPEKHTPHEIKHGQKIYLTENGKPLPPIPLEVFSTTNPSGVGRNAVKKRFIDPQSYPSEVLKNEISFELEGEKHTVVRTQVSIFGSFGENKYLDPIYKAGLIQACENDPHKYAAWIKGSWDVSEGGALDDLWSEQYHKVPRFPIPVQWKIDRTFDWGSSHPFCLLWWAEANGETAKWQDKFGKWWHWTPAKGSLICIYERYGQGLKAHTGLRWSAKKIAQTAKEIEFNLYRNGWIKSRVQAGPADTQIWDVRESDVEVIADKMASIGIYFTRGDKSKGSRVTGLELMRERLTAALTGEGPAIYFMANCNNCIEYLPSLPRDPDNLEDVAECPFDHLWDTARYRVLRGGHKYATNLTSTWGR